MKAVVTDGGWIWYSETSHKLLRTLLFHPILFFCHHSQDNRNHAESESDVSLTFHTHAKRWTITTSMQTQLLSTHMHKCAHAHIHTHARAHTHTHTHTHARAHTRRHAHIQTPTVVPGMQNQALSIAWPRESHAEQCVHGDKKWVHATGQPSKGAGDWSPIQRRTKVDHGDLRVAIDSGNSGVQLGVRQASKCNSCHKNCSTSERVHNSSLNSQNWPEMDSKQLGAHYIV